MEGMSSLKKITFIHTADLHLDSPFVGMKNLPPVLYKRMKESTFMAFRNLVDYCIRKQIDFLLISGDLFDGEDRSIRAQIRLKNEMERLEEANIRVFIIHGNHDHLGGSWVHIPMPANVHIFAPQPEQVSFLHENGTHVSVVGYSYEKRHEPESKVSLFPKLEGELKIAMLHGHDGSATDHLAYAPFKIGDLLNTNYDYWALGHIHKRQILHNSPPIIYPGNIQGRHINEEGKKGFIEVEWTTAQQEVTFVPCHDIEWRTETIEATKEIGPEELYQACLKRKQQLCNEMERAIIRIVIKSDSELPSKILQFIESGQLIELLQEEDYEEGKSFVWINDIHINKQTRSHPSLSGHPFLSSLNKVMEQTEATNELGDLFLHKKASRFLQDSVELEYEKLEKEAKELLIQLLNS